MSWLLIFGLVLFYVVIVLPIRNSMAIKRIDSEIHDLKIRLDGDGSRHRAKVLREEAKSEPVPQSPKATPWEEPLIKVMSQPDEAVVSVSNLQPQPQSSPEPVDVPFQVDAKWMKDKSKPSTRSAGIISFSDFDRILARLPVWIGAVALIFACLYFVKYSIESGLLSPIVRILIGAGTSLAATIAGYVLMNRPSIANSTRIAQALAGAGIAGLYICSYMAAHLYALISSECAILLMAAVTGLAIVLALRLGAPVAVLGLLGGFALPLMTEFRQVSTGTLFTYFYILTMGLILVSTLRGWGWLALLALLGFYGWGFGTMLDRADTVHSAVYMGGFSLLVIASLLMIQVVVKAAWGRKESADLGIIERSLITSIALGTVTQVFSMVNIEMSLLTAGMYGLLVIAVTVLAVFRPQTYFYPAIASVLLFSGLFVFTDSLTLPIFTLSVTVLAGLSALACRVMWRPSVLPVQWSAYTVTSIIAAFAVTYTHETFLPTQFNSIYGWEIVTFSLSALGFYFTRQWRQHGNDKAAVIWAVMSAFFAAFCIIVFFATRSTTGLAMLAMAAVLALNYARSGYDMLRRFVPVFFSLAACFLAKDAFRFLEIATGELQNKKTIGIYMQSIFINEGATLFAIGITVSVLGGIIAWAMGRNHSPSSTMPVADNKPYAVIAGVITAGSLYTLLQLFVYGYIWPKSALNLDGYIHLRVLITALFHVAAIVCCLCWKRYPVLSKVACGLLLAGLFRTVYFDLLVSNPMWASGVNVGATPLFNLLLPMYLLPAAACTALVATMLRHMQKSHAGIFAGAAALLAFIFISLSVRQWFQGGVLAYGGASLAEVFSYSVVWLLFGLAVVTGGALTQIRAVRLTGAAMVALVIAKVFLYDASVLEGLYRVLAFFGLGGSLLALGWFYGVIERKAQAQAEAG